MKKILIVIGVLFGLLVLAAAILFFSVSSTLSGPSKVGDSFVTH